MKKFVLSLLATVTILGGIAPSISLADSEGTQVSANSKSGDYNFPTNIGEKQIGKSKKQGLTQELIETVDPYVILKNGKNHLVNVQELKQKISRKEFKLAKDSIRTGNRVLQNSLAVNHLNSNGWDYHWWGYEQDFNYWQTEDAIDYYLSVAAGAAIAVGGTFWLPPVAGVIGASGGYFALLAVRMDHNNQGNGVHVSITWAAVFNVSPL